MPLSEIEAKTKEELISKIIEHEMSKGKTKEVAAALAFQEAKRRGYGDLFQATTMYSEYTAQLGKAQKLNGVLKVPVTLAAEMIQDYHRSELPWLEDLLPKDITYVKVLKSYDELKKMVQDLETRKIDKIPFVMPHTEGTFHKDQVPANMVKYISKYIADTEIRGYVKDIWADDKSKKIKGDLYLKIADHDPVFISDCENGKVTNVSIGFICDWDVGGEFNGESYFLKQTTMQLGHLAGLVHAQGKCPAGICGINQDHKVEITADQLHHHLIAYRDKILLTMADRQITTDQRCPCATENSPWIRHDSHGALVGLKKENSQLSNNAGMLMTPEEEIAALKAQVKSLQDASKASTQADSDTKIKKLEFDLAARDQAIKDLQEENKSCKEAKKKMEDTMKADLLPKLIAAYPGKLIGDRKIEELCLHDMKMAWDSVVALKDAQLKNNGIGAGTPMPSEEDRAKLTTNHSDKKIEPVLGWGSYDEKVLEDKK